MSERVCCAIFSYFVLSALQNSPHAAAMSYETTRASDLEASRRVLEAERRRERRGALIFGVLVALWVATAIALVLKATGVLP